MYHTGPHSQRKLSSWAIPGIYVVATVVFGMTVPRMEHYLLPQLVSTMSAAAAMSPLCSPRLQLATV